MSRTSLVSGLLGMAVTWQAALAAPPAAPSGRLVWDEAARLRAEVQRLEKEVARDHSEPGAAEKLDVTRARLAAAEGRLGDARAAWQKVIASREVLRKEWERIAPRVCPPPEPAFIQGPVAMARCELAEVEGDRATLAVELPKVIAYYEGRLRALDLFRKHGVIGPEDGDEGRAMRSELRDLRRRLEALQRR